APVIRRRLRRKTPDPSWLAQERRREPAPGPTAIASAWRTSSCRWMNPTRQRSCPCSASVALFSRIHICGHSGEVSSPSSSPSWVGLRWPPWDW
ncbi:NRT2.5, partial [Symbiodinium sp. KB8]